MEQNLFLSSQILCQIWPDYIEKELVTLAGEQINALVSVH
jgi:hypothetical protein